jgi:hypothetical protein
MKKRSIFLVRSLGFSGFIVLLFLLSAGTASPYEAEEGYDENTEMTLSGAVQDIVTGERGPVVIKVLYRGRIYNVITAPPWYLVRRNIVFRRGLEIEVTGSKVLGRDGALYLISRRLKEPKTGREVMLRDDFLRPLWRGRRHSW